MAYTNSGLVAYCKAALKLNTSYMWGGLFREITTDYVGRLAAQYPSQYPSARRSTLNKRVGKNYYGVDCVGLIKSYYFGGVGTAKNAKGYNASTDYSVGTMYTAAKVKGEIKTMPKKPGILVMTKTFGHVGVYVGDGKVIESTLRGVLDGVVETNFSDVAWAYWCQCPCIADDTTTTESKPTATPPVKNESTSSNATLTVGTKVKFTGTVQYPASTSPASKALKAVSGDAKITAVANRAAHPYHIIGDNGGVYGWVDSSTVTSKLSALTKGTKITLKNAGLYASVVATSPVNKISGTYYIYDGMIVEGFLRVCPTTANVGKTPTGTNVTGWVKISDIT